MFLSSSFRSGYQILKKPLKRRVARKHFNSNVNYLTDKKLVSKDPYGKKKLIEVQGRKQKIH